LKGERTVFLGEKNEKGEQRDICVEPVGTSLGLKNLSGPENSGGRMDVMGREEIGTRNERCKGGSRERNVGSGDMGARAGKKKTEKYRPKTNEGRDLGWGEFRSKKRPRARGRVREKEEKPAC